MRKPRPLPLLLAPLLLAPLLAGCTLVGIRTSEEPSYEVLARDDDAGVEVRRYPALLLAETEVGERSWDAASDRAFERLYGYLSGRNAANEELAMTIPVLWEPEGDVATSPAPEVEPRPLAPGWRFAFVLPADVDPGEAPEPLDPEVRVDRVGARTVAALRFSGSLSEERFVERTAELVGWLEANGYAWSAEPMGAAYDPPWTLPFLRRNEVLIVVDG